MKREFFNKAVSLTAALTIGCTNLIGTGLNLTASANEQETVAEEVSTELIPVIVKVSGDAVLATPEGVAQGDEFLNTEQAVEMSNALVDTQAYVQDEIRQIYPELEVGYSYSVLYNGFSCEIPENLIEQVEALPYVEAVAKVQQTAAPQMASAPALGGYPAYYDVTGCSGEGQVIAVLDSELNINHPMFSALDESIEVKLTEEDIAEIASTIGFNVDIDPALAYRSSKLPYVIDYVDSDPYEDVLLGGRYSDVYDEYHGTHVAGIAAGNAFTDKNGNTYSGIAKDAQLVFMAVENELGFSDSAILAALEDAVKLHADVINMSFNGNGEHFGKNPYQEAYETAVNAGVTICMCAGNQDNGEIYLGRVNQPENPDIGMMSINITENTPVLAVASAENTYTEHNRAFQVGDDLIRYMETYRSKDDEYGYFIGDELSGQYEYVYCGTGTQEEFAQQDVTGKIVLVSRTGSDVLLSDKAVFAQEAGAVGIISGVREGENMDDGAALVEHALPSTFVSYADMQKMIQAENKVLTFTDETIDVDVATAVSDYTSWGVHQNLELRPDIMGIGGHVESANYSDGVTPLSGTSMASPYVAGCATVLNEYLTKKGIELEGAEKLRYMRNLLMTSAFPYEEDGMFVTPRRQGAGMISLDRAIADKVLLTGNEGETKIQLRDNVGDEFSFDLNLTNISEEDVDFTSARLVLTTDSTEFSEEHQTDIIRGQQALNCSYDLSALLHIGAGESRTETVSVSLDANQTAEIQEIFKNGFFVEGYLLLEGAENCCDISVPLLGFHGDWSQIPIFNDEFTILSRMDDDLPILNGISLAETINLMKEIIPNIPEDKLSDPDISMDELIATYATPEQLEQMGALNTGDYYISPNGDGLADQIGMVFAVERLSSVHGLNVYNEAGELLLTGEDSLLWIDEGFNAETLRSLDGLEDGIYTGKMIGNINYAPSVENPQELAFSFTIDTKAPEMTSELTEKDGRKILKITASDQNLDGIYITGLKENDENANMNLFGTMSIAREALSMGGNFARHAYDSSQLPAIGKFLKSSLQDSDLERINFADMLIPQPDENGVFTFEYDITDFASYTISAMDKAYNFSSVESEILPAEELKDGVYLCCDGLLCFADGKMSTASFKDGAVTENSYTFKDGVLDIQNGEQISVQQVSEGNYRMNVDGKITIVTYHGEGTLEDYPFYTIDQLEKRSWDILVNIGGFQSCRCETSVDNGVAMVASYGIYEDTEYNSGYYKIDLFTGETVEKPEGFMEFSPITFEDFCLNGLIFSIENLEQGEIYYANFNSGKAFKQTDGTEVSISYELNNTDLKFTIDGKDISFTDYAFPEEYSMVLTMETADGEEPQKVKVESGGLASKFCFYSNTQLKEMALDFYEAQNGTRPENVEAIINQDGKITLQMTETENYLVDPKFGIGVNQDGNMVDLTSVLPPMEDPFKSGTWFAYDALDVSKYFIFNGNQGGQIVPIDGTEPIDFTYTMTATGILLTTEDNTMTFQLSPKEDGTIEMSGFSDDYDYFSSTMTYLNDSTETVECYTIEELTDMAKAHAPVEILDTHTYVNPDGTLSIFLYDENYESVGGYTVSFETGEGKDLMENPVDIKEAFVPEMPEMPYSLDELSDMAKKNYEKKNGTVPANADAKINKDGSISIELTDKDGSVLDTYTIDAESGVGRDSNGEVVNLPLTGNNVPDTAVKASASAFLTFAGLFAVLKSGIFRKKRENN